MADHFGTPGAAGFDSDYVSAKSHIGLPPHTNDYIVPV